MHVMLYIIDKLELPGNDCFENLNSLLSVQRYQKVQRLRSNSGRDASAAAYLLLRFALFEVYGINEPVEFELAAKGKPTLKVYPDIHFNLSHSQGVAACVVADFEVGVDVQNVRKVSGKTAKRVLTKEEYEVLLTTNNPDDYFCKIWTIKESYVKMTGQGITAELGEISAEQIENIFAFKGDDYYCSVCSPAVSTEKVRHVRRNDFEQLYK